MAFENVAGLNYAIAYPEVYNSDIEELRNMLSRVEQRALVNIQNTDWGFLAGYVFIDPYAKWHVSDSALWLMLFAEAYKIDQDFAAILFYIRGGGTVLEKDKDFGYRLVPVIGECGWPSQDYYNQEKQWLNRYGDQLMMLLRCLNDNLAGTNRR